MERLKIKQHLNTHTSSAAHAHVAKLMARDCQVRVNSEDASTPPLRSCPLLQLFLARAAPARLEPCPSAPRAQYLQQLGLRVALLLPARVELGYEGAAADQRGRRAHLVRTALQLDLVPLRLLHELGLMLLLQRVELDAVDELVEDRANLQGGDLLRVLEHQRLLVAPRLLGLTGLVGLGLGLTRRVGVGVGSRVESQVESRAESRVERVEWRVE